jgi:DNA modification methylase
VLFFDHFSKMNIEHVQTEDLIPYARNAKKHDAAQVAAIAGSIREFGFNNPVLINAENGIIAGHGRTLAAHQLGLATVPCLRLTHLTDSQRRAYILADNRLAEIGGGWDSDMLAAELEALAAEGVAMEDLGFDADALEELGASFGDEPETPDADAEPQIDKADELRAKWGIEPGQLWELGAHRLLCGDSTIPEHVAKLMGGEKAQLIHADPPYGMGKEKDGVQNDNLYREELDAFQMAWWRAFRPHAEDNASAYIWGNAEDLWRLWYCGGLKKSERITMRNEIVWDKGHGQGIGSADHRMFPTVSERCLFFMLGEQGFNNNADNYWEGFEPIRLYLQTERDKAGMTNKTVADLFGFYPSMPSHWFSKSQWSFPQKEQYKAIQKAAKGDAFKREYDDLKREYDDLKREYDDLKREFYSTRAHFDNTHDNMTDTWRFQRVTGEERHGHATPKPVEMMKRVMLSSLPKGGICLEPFGGSGSTLMGAENTGRKCRAIEISPAYVAVAIQRWADATGKEPKRLA